MDSDFLSLLEFLGGAFWCGGCLAFIRALGGLTGKKSSYDI
jgi:hypothetical protein